MAKGKPSTVSYHQSLGITPSDDHWILGQDSGDEIGIDDTFTTAAANGKRRASTSFEGSAPAKKSKNDTQLEQGTDDASARELLLARFLKIAKKHPEQAAKLLFDLDSTKDTVQQLRDQVIKLVEAVIGLQASVANSGGQPLQYPAPPAAPKSKEDRARLRWDEAQQKEDKKDKKHANREKTQVRLKPRKSFADDSDNDSDNDSDDDGSPGASGSKAKAERFIWSESWFVNRDGEWVGFIECAALATLCRDAFQGWFNNGKVDLTTQTWPNISLPLKIELCTIAEAAFPNIALCSLHYKLLLFAQTIFRAWRTKFLKTLKRSNEKGGRFSGTATPLLPAPLQVKQESGSQLPTPPSGSALFKMPESSTSGPSPWTPAPNSNGYSLNVSMDDSPVVNGVTGRPTSIPAATPTPPAHTPATFTLNLPSVNIPPSISRASEVSIPIDPILLAYDAAQAQKGPTQSTTRITGQQPIVVAVAQPIVTQAINAQPAVPQHINPEAQPFVVPHVGAQHSGAHPAQFEPNGASSSAVQHPAGTIQPTLVKLEATNPGIQSAVAHHVVNQPTAAQPGSTQPATTQLVNTHPLVDGIHVQPVGAQAATTVVQPVGAQAAATQQVTAAQPSFAPPAAMQSAFSLPSGAAANPWLSSENGPTIPGAPYQTNRTTLSGRNFYGHYWKKNIRPHGTTPENKWYWDALGDARRGQWNAMAERFKNENKKIDKVTLQEIYAGPLPV